MDWAHDNVGIREADLDEVFKFDPKESTLVEVLSENQHKPKISTLWSSNNEELDGQWQARLDEVDERIKGYKSQESGLILVLARRGGERSTETIEGATASEWLQSIEPRLAPPTQIRKATTFAGLSEKTMSGLSAQSDESFESKVPNRPTSSSRGVRTLPFSRKTFKTITTRFHTHGSIAKIISRSDVPICSCEKVNMDTPAYVYNCRTSNAWELDLALSATYFPKKRLTFAIIFGSTLAIEKEIVKRLELDTRAIKHPLLIVGLIVEFERARHAKLVNKMSIVLENQILEFQVTTEELKGRVAMEEKYKRNETKRTAWLDTVYLKNGLLTWKTQLSKLVQHINDLENHIFLHGRLRTDSGMALTMERDHDLWTYKSDDESNFGDNRQPIHFSNRKAQGKHDRSVLNSGKKIRGRLSAIQDEYDDWVRDCSMRVEGMAMATQWASGEINVEIALATRRDSKYMRSIAILTMIFLPGTWLAGIFSMTFFDWKTENGGIFVSKYLWIYFVMTILLTGGTVGCWYYVTVYHPKHRRDIEDEKDD